MATCSFCGRPVPPVASFCPSCGAAVGGASTTSSPFGPTSPAFPPTGPLSPSWGTGPSPSTRDADRLALGRVRLAALLALFGGALGAAELVLNTLNPFVSSSKTSSGSTILAFQSPGVWAGILVAAIVLVVAELLLYWGAFRALRAHDPRFSAPATLAVIAVIGIVLVFLGTALLLAEIISFVQCVGTGGGPPPSSCVASSGLLRGLAVVGLGAIVALIGYLGVLVGIWRLGTRYAGAGGSTETFFHAGAILLIFPYLGLVGAVLILVAAHRALEAAGAAPSTPAPAFPGAR